MREKRDEILILRITKTEKNRIYEKMYGMGIRSLSAYMPPKKLFPAPVRKSLLAR